MKAVFITNIPSPFQVKFCKSLQNKMDMTFLYAMDINSNRPDYWKVELDDKNIILNEKKMFMLSKKYGRYLNLDLFLHLKKINPDIVWISDMGYPTSVAAYYWARRHKKKVAIFKEISRHPKNLKIYNKIYRHLDGLLVVGKLAVDQYSQYFKTKIYNFPYAADLETKLNTEKIYDTKRVKFLYSSRFVESHNPKMVLSVVKKLSEKYSNFSLLMASYGELREECEKYVVDNNLSSIVTFKNTLSSWEEVNSLFTENDVLVFPATFNSWALVIPEAMAAGMAVITTKGVMASELLSEDQIIDINPDALYSSMERYILNPEIVKVVGEQNRIDCISETYQEKGKYLFSIFNEILNS